MESFFNFETLEDVNDLFENEMIVVTEAKYKDCTQLVVSFKDSCGDIVKSVTLCEKRND